MRRANGNLQVMKGGSGHLTLYFDGYSRRKQAKGPCRPGSRKEKLYEGVLMLIFTKYEGLCCLDTVFLRLGTRSKRCTQGTRPIKEMLETRKRQKPKQESLAQRKKRRAQRARRGRSKDRHKDRDRHLAVKSKGL